MKRRRTAECKNAENQPGTSSNSTAVDNRVDDFINEEELMKAVHYSVINIADDVKTDILTANGEEIEFSADVLSKISSFAYDTVARIWTPDLLSFSKHAGRQNVNNDDVLLLLRRNEALVEELTAVDNLDGILENAVMKKGRSRKTNKKIDEEIAQNSTSNSPVASSTPFKPCIPLKSIPELQDITALPFCEKNRTVMSNIDNDDNDIHPVNAIESISNVNDEGNNSKLLRLDLESNNRPVHSSTPNKPFSQILHMPRLSDISKIEREKEDSNYRVTMPLASSTPFKSQKLNPMPGLSVITPISSKIRTIAPSPIPLENITEDDEDVIMELDTRPLQLNEDDDSFSRDVFFDDATKKPSTSTVTKTSDSISSFDLTPQDFIQDHNSPQRNSCADDSFDVFQETPRKEVPVPAVKEQKSYDSFDDENQFVSSSRPSLLVSSFYQKNKPGTSRHTQNIPKRNTSDRTLVATPDNNRTLTKLTVFKRETSKSEKSKTTPWQNDFAAFSFDTLEDDDKDNAILETKPICGTTSNTSTSKRIPNNSNSNNQFSFSPDSFDEEPTLPPFKGLSKVLESKQNVSKQINQSGRITPVMPISDLMESFLDDETDFIGLDSIM